MSHKIVKMNELLKTLEEAVKDPERILTKDITNPLTNTKQREALTLFLTAAVLNESFREQGVNNHLDVCQNDLSEDRLDGFLSFTNENGESEELEFEQVMLTVGEVKGTTYDTDTSDLVIEKIKQKHNKGYENPKAITLVIFLDIKGQTIPQKVKKYLRGNNIFKFYILIIFKERTKGTGSYVYTVIDLNPERVGFHSRFVVEINNSFEGYTVRLSE